jgi:hypothetical protein
MRNQLWLVVLPFLGCSLPAPQPPSAEFLVADGSSTYWVKSSPAGIRARFSPLILARAGGRYYEVFVGESTRSYEDAVFSGERIYRRDLMTGDSTLLWQDAKIEAWEKVYLSRHPAAKLLESDADGNDDVALSATGEADILGIVGPYVLYTHRSMLENSDVQSADTARGIIDVRLGKSVPITVLAHDTVAMSDGGIREKGLVRWRHSGYDVIARFDNEKRQTQVVLRDFHHREWTLGYVDSPVPRIFWLDEPRVDGRLRTAIANAFEGALLYEETLQLVSHDRPDPSAPHPRIKLSRFLGHPLPLLARAQ